MTPAQLEPSPKWLSLCGLCKGSCNLVWIKKGRYKWFTCPACNGLGCEDL